MIFLVLYYQKFFELWKPNPKSIGFGRRHSPLIFELIVFDLIKKKVCSDFVEPTVAGKGYESLLKTDWETPIFKHVEKVKFYSKKCIILITIPLL